MKTLQELSDWTTYRDHLKAEFKRLSDGEQPFLVSKHRNEFKVKDSPWKGRLIFVGERGEKQAKQLTLKDGVKFLEGKCTVQGKEISLSGIESTHHLAIQTLLKKTTLGYKLAGVAGASAVAPEVKGDVLAAVCDGKEDTYAALESALGSKLGEMHTAFGGKRGLGAVKLILRDVCAGDPNKLKQLVDALG